jgi:hypothetical protein
LCGLGRWAYERRKRYQSLRPSPEYFTAKLSTDVVAARAHTGEKGEAWIYSTVAPMELHGVYKDEHSLNREWFCYLNLPRSKTAEFHNELIRRVKSQIRQGKPGEHVSTSEFESEWTLATSEAYGQTMKYHCGDVHGTIRLYLIQNSDQSAFLLAAVSEHRVP